MTDRYRQLFLSLGDAVFIEDASGKIIDANTAAAWMLGHPVQDLINRNSSEFVAPAHRERVALQRQVLATVERHQFDAQYLTANGATVNLLLDVSVMPQTEKSPEGILYLVVARQVSNRDELERELRLQRQSALTAHRGTFFAKFYISSRNEISRYPPLGPGEKPRPLDWVHQLLPGSKFRKALEAAWKGEDVLLPAEWYSPASQASTVSGAAGRDEGETLVRQRWMEIMFHPLRLRGSDVTDVCVRVWDRTDERLEKEEQRWNERRQFATLQTQLLFHEFNNYLSVILAQASGLRLTLPAEQLPPPAIGGIIDAAQQAAGLLRRALESAGQSEGERQPLSVNAVASDCGTMLAHMAKGRLNVAVNLASDVPPVAAGADLLRSMIMAIGRHIIQNVRSGGRLSVKTFRVQGATASLPHGAGISIGDESGATQAGASPSENNIESPDLMLAKSIIRSMRGQIEVVTAGTQGTVMEITLPAFDASRQTPHAAVSDQSPEAQPPAAARPQTPIAVRPAVPVLAPSISSPCKILLADDEENFRLFTSWALRERGFEVVVAKDGQEAFERFQEAPETYHLVILDAYMPRMGGLEAYLRMQIQRPELPVLFASGFARGPSVDALVSGCPGPAAVLLKPFSSEDLINAVSQALARQE